MAEFTIGDALKEFLKKSKLKGGVQALQIEEKHCCRPEVYKFIIQKNIKKHQRSCVPWMNN